MALPIQQKNRLLQVSPILGDNFLLLHLSGEEQISRPYQFQLRLISDQAKHSLLEYIEQPINLTILDSKSAGPRYISGVIEKAQRNFNPDQKGFYQYQISVVPHLWKLDLPQTKKRRIFRKKTLTDIAQTLFKENGLVADTSASRSGAGAKNMLVDYSKLSAKPEKREYQLQLDETDLAFLQRIFSEEGVFYYFTHTKDKHTLILADSESSYPKESVDLSKSDSPAVISNWKARQAVTSNKLSLVGDNLRIVNKPIEVSQPFNNHSSKLNREMMQFDGTLIDNDSAETKLQYQLQAMEIQAQQFEAVGRGLGINSGLPFSYHSPLDADSKKYLAIKVQHEAFDFSLLHYHPETILSEVDRQRYQNLQQSAVTFDFLKKSTADDKYEVTEKIDYLTKVEAMSQDLGCYRNAVIPRPEIMGFSIAEVVCSQNDKSAPNPDERAVELQYPWDVDNQLVPPTRVATSAAGAGWGNTWTPRLGDQVVVQYLNGDIYRPIVSEAVYQGDNQPIHNPKDSPARTGIRTKSVANGDADDEGSRANEICFDDQKDNDALNFYAVNNYDVSVENQHSLSIDKDCNIKIEKGDRQLKSANGNVILEAEDQIVLQTGNSSISLTQDGVEIKSDEVHFNSPGGDVPESIEISD